MRQERSSVAQSELLPCGRKMVEVLLVVAWGSLQILVSFRRGFYQALLLFLASLAFAVLALVFGIVMSSFLGFPENWIPALCLGAVVGQAIFCVALPGKWERFWNGILVLSEGLQILVVATIVISAVLACVSWLLG